MDIVEVRRRFDAYASGSSSGPDLRSAVSEGVHSEPEMAPAYTALTTAFFRGADADTQLRDSILADIASIFGAPLTPLPPAEPEQLSIENPTVVTGDEKPPAAAIDWARTDGPARGTRERLVETQLPYRNRHGHRIELGFSRTIERTRRHARGGVHVARPL